MLEKMDLDQIVARLAKIEHGFTHIVAAGDTLLRGNRQDVLPVARALLNNQAYQARMLATYLLGHLWASSEKAAETLIKTKVADDSNWRVQEMLARAFDGFCRTNGYEQSLPVIDEWLGCQKSNRVRAVIEGLRVWTARPYFKEHPESAIQRISGHKGDASEYVRKSVGNALRDIGKKHAGLVAREISSWDTTNERILFTRKLVLKSK